MILERSATPIDRFRTLKGEAWLERFGPGKATPRAVSDWRISKHGKNGVDCSACHGDKRMSSQDVASGICVSPWLFAFPDLLVFYDAPTVIEQKLLVMFYDFLLVFAKNPVIFFCTLSLPQ